MATIKRELSSKINGNGKSQIILRVSIARGLQPRIKSGLFITPGRFKDGMIIKPRANQVEAGELRNLESQLVSIEQFLLDLCTSTSREELSKEFLTEALDKFLNPDKYEEMPMADLWDSLDLFLEKHPLSAIRGKQYKVLGRALKRFSLYAKAKHLGVDVALDKLTSVDLEAFTEFLLNEQAIYEEMPTLYEEIPVSIRKEHKSRCPKPRGANYLSNLFRMFRAFYNWCVEEGITQNNPFIKFKGICSERYGRPYYISSEERDLIADFDLSDSPALEIQRDIFVFHCLIGCRVSDLMRLTSANVINGAIEYIASKTRRERPEVIRVPLHERAVALIQKYEGQSSSLLPFITPQRYNDAIKEIFTRCGITRNVTVLNPITGEEEQRPINEIASSHIARRTFVGNLYKKVKDPSLVGALSGHVEGSKAFARYRDIDEDIKKEVINLL